MRLNCMILESGRTRIQTCIALRTVLVCFHRIPAVDSHPCNGDAGGRRFQQQVKTGLHIPCSPPHETSSAPISTLPLSSSRIFTDGPHLLSRMRPRSEDLLETALMIAFWHMWLERKYILTALQTLLAYTSGIVPAD
jgi:hypothetical protein